MERMKDLRRANSTPTSSTAPEARRPWSAASRFVAHGGTYVLVSIVQGNICFSDPEFHKRETTLLSSRNATLADFATVMAAMRDGKVPTRAIKTHSAPLWEVAQRRCRNGSGPRRGR